MAERNALTKEEFETATDVYLVDKKEPENPKPDTWEEGKYFGTPAAAGGKGEGDATTPAPPGGKGDATTPAGGEVTDKVKNALLDVLLLMTGLKKSEVITEEEALKGAEAFCVSYREDFMKNKEAAAGDAPPKDEADAAAGGTTGAAAGGDGKNLDGGSRRTKRKGHKGRKGSHNNNQQQSSQNGGRRSRKNRRKQSRRRKH